MQISTNVIRSVRYVTDAASFAAYNPLMSSLAIVHSRAQVGVASPPVRVEVHLANGLPQMAIVGMPETAVKESRDRVRGALLNSGFDFPQRRIIVNLAPADLPKVGGRFDLPIALGVLLASGQLELEDADFECFAELALGGELRGVSGALPSALAARNAGKSLFVATDNADEAALVQDLLVYPFEHLLELCAHLAGRSRIKPHRARHVVPAKEAVDDFADVRGQPGAKRALEIAAAGGHNILMCGPPGTGKTMLASRLPTIMPPMSDSESIETAAVASISHYGIDISRWRQRPFRAPHHTASGAALVGGGGVPKPGEISLAHNGVLFLDELPEFSRRVLEVLREPLESGTVTISRAARQAEFPARFQLVAAMNPCPCGYSGDLHRQCRCSPDQIDRYRSRISGPLLDRLDLQINVPRVAYSDLRDPQAAEGSSTIQLRVEVARRLQIERAGKPNSALGSREIDRDCRLDDADASLLDRAMQRLGLSPRAYHRILRVSRTIADLDNAAEISTIHLSEALSYRVLDRVN